MEITLKQLNDSYQSLNQVAESLINGKMKYRFAKLLRVAKDEIETLGEHLAAIAQDHGAEMLGGNAFRFDEAKQKEEAIKFNFEASLFMKSEKIKFNFDSKYFTFDELTKAENPQKPISAAVLANLLWLVSDETTDEQLQSTTA